MPRIVIPVNYLHFIKYLCRILPTYPILDGFQSSIEFPVMPCFKHHPGHDVVALVFGPAMPIGLESLEEPPFHQVMHIHVCIVTKEVKR